MTPNRTRRTELLADSQPRDLIDVAEACLSESPDFEMLVGPQVGMVTLTVREPVESTRFQLGDVLVTTTEVAHRGQRGWSMVMGDDREVSLAAAICDAEVEASGPHCNAVIELCRRTDQRLAVERSGEWSELESTVVHFEEMSE